MEPDELLYSPFGSEALDADVFSPDDIFAGYRILVRHNYNLLCGLYEVERIEDKRQNLMLILPRLVKTEEGFAERFEKIGRQLREINTAGLLALEDFGQTEGRFFILYEPFHGLILPDFFAERLKARLDMETEATPPETEATPPETGPAPAPAPETADPFAAPVEEIYPIEKADSTSKAPAPPNLSALGSPYLPPAGVKSFVQKIGGALHRLHRAGIHHFNIASASVLTDGESEFKLWGAGLYEMVGKPLFERLASAGIPPIIGEDQRRLLNPVEGLAPEIRRGELPDLRADVYGLAAVSYELLTGEQPKTNPAPPASIDPEFEKPWNDVLLRGLSKEQHLRQETVDDFIREVEGRSRRQLSQTRKVWLGRLARARDFVSKNLLALLTFLLAVVGVLMFYQWTSRSTIEPIDTVTTPRPVAVVRDGEAATHVIRLSPPGASITLFDPSPRTLRADEDGQIRLRVTEGNPLLRVEAPGHRNHEVRLRPSAQTTELAIELEVAYAIPVFNAHPASEVWYRRLSADGRGDWQSLGEIPEDGTGRFEEIVGQGLYDFEVRHPIFRPVRFREIELTADREVFLEAVQSALPASMQITGEPADGKVSVNGILLGSPPLIAEGITPDAPVLIRFEREGYRPLERTIELEPAQILEVELGSLERIYAPLTLRVRGLGRDLTSDEQLTIKRGSEVLELAGDGRLSHPIGRFPFTFEHPDYETGRLPAEIREGTENRIDIRLEPKPAVVTLDIVPEGTFTLRVDGREVPAIRRFGLAPGRTHALEVVVDRHAPLTASFSPGPNEQIEWRVDPPFLTPPSDGDAWTFPYHDFDFVWIASGDFMMGSPRTEPHRLPNEADGSGAQIRTVFTRGFWMSTTPVTQEFFEAVTGTNPSRFSNPRHPVESISWADAVAFTERLTEQERRANRLPEGYVYRLPTQAEWEYSARAGTTSPFYWGDEASPSNSNFQGTYPRSLEMPAGVQAKASTTPVRSFPPNPWGLYDVFGNVRSFTLDSYNGRYPVTRPLTDWVETRASDRITVRGGGWSDTADRSRAASRDRMELGQVNDSTGFRIVLGPEL